MTNRYRSAELRPTAQGAALVFHCSDPRFLPRFEEFCREHLKLESFALIAVPGGPQVLLLENQQLAWDWAKFMVELTQTQRIVLIVHDDCRWYLQSLPGQDAAKVQVRMMEDARAVRAALMERFGQRTIEIYHARLEGNRVVFDSVDEASAANR